MLKIREIQCKSAIGKCGFPGGGWAVNPYVGCGHGCVYCYARFMRRFTGHTEPWGSFVDVRINIAAVLRRQLQSPQYRQERIYIGTVTDPYQPLERKYRLTRKILEVISDLESTSHSGKVRQLADRNQNPDSGQARMTRHFSVSILTKSDLVLRDMDLLKKLKDVDVEFTINTMDEKWARLVEPAAPPIASRLAAIKILRQNSISAMVMMGPYWPYFSNASLMFKKFKSLKVKHVFAESMNTVGGNWSGVETVLAQHFPRQLAEIKAIMFDRRKFGQFYGEAYKKILVLAKRYHLPITVYFGSGHAGNKFK